MEIKADSVKYSKPLAIFRNRIEGYLVKKLEAAHRSGPESNVLAARSSTKLFNAKHEGCVVGTRMRAMRNEEIGVAREA